MAEFRPDKSLMQLGLYDYVWGDNTMLQKYLDQKFQAEEAEKNRQAQRAYNEYLKEYDRAKAAAEQAAADAKEKQAKKIELAGLYKDYNNAQGAQEQAIIKRRIDALEDELGYTNVKDKMTAAFEADKAAKAQAEADESVRQRNAMNIKAKIISKINKAKSDADKQKLLDEFNAEFAKSRSVAKEDLKATTTEEFVSAFNDAGIKQEDYANLTQEDANDVNAKILGFDTQEAANKGAVKSAVATHLGKKTAESLEEKDEKKKLADSARKKKAAGQEGRITKKEQEALDEGF